MGAQAPGAVGQGCPEHSLEAHLSWSPAETPKLSECQLLIEGGTVIPPGLNPEGSPPPALCEFLAPSPPSQELFEVEDWAREVGAGSWRPTPPPSILPQSSRPTGTVWEGTHLFTSTGQNATPFSKGGV